MISVIKQIPIVQETQFLIELSPLYCLQAYLNGGISDLLFTKRATSPWLVIWVSWMCDRSISTEPISE